MRIVKDKQLHSFIYSPDLNIKLQEENNLAKNNINKSIDEGLDKIFSDVEKEVDNYLNWHFSLLGNYQELALVFSGDASKALADNLKDQLFARTKFNEKFNNFNNELIEETNQQLMSNIPPLVAKIDFEQGTCTIADMGLSDIYSNLERDKVRAIISATSGLTVGALFAKKAASTIVSKIVATKGFATIAALIVKATVKKGGAVILPAAVATAMCSPTGPLALLCGFLAALGTWVGVDTVGIKIDEKLHRKEMEEGMRETIQEQKIHIADELKQSHNDYIDSVMSHVNEVFVPGRDGM